MEFSFVFMGFPLSPNFLLFSLSFAKTELGAESGWRHQCRGWMAWQLVVVFYPHGSPWAPEASLVGNNLG